MSQNLWRLLLWRSIARILTKPGPIPIQVGSTSCKSTTPHGNKGERMIQR
uniref:Uncharacterized protein n=1 Tax=Physcomitrium patens TaxID=3218 RepID=A0A2K1JME0_PHYPA|nr:hypothetical protein PHYPA_017534 [Physcomitrium patens]